MTKPTGYYATINVPLGNDRVGTYVRTEVLTKHETWKEAFAEARRVAATRPGTKGSVLGAQHVEE